MINITIPKSDVIITKSTQFGDITKSRISSVYGFIDYKRIPRGTPGIYMFYSKENKLLYVGKSKSLRGRVRDHFLMDSYLYEIGAIEEIYTIECFFENDPLKREIYETWIINERKSEHNRDKAFFR